MLFVKKNSPSRPYNNNSQGTVMNNVVSASSLLTSLCSSPSQFTIVIIQRFQILIHISGLPYQPQVKRTQYSHIPAKSIHR